MPQLAANQDMAPAARALRSPIRCRLDESSVRMHGVSMFRGLPVPTPFHIRAIARSAVIAPTFLIASATVVAAAGPALAPSFSSVIAWPGLPQDDLDRMEAAAARLYEDRSVGTIERWRSPDTRNAGEVKLMRSFDSHGMPCRTLDYTIRFEEQKDRPSHYVLNWCKLPEGTWKIVELARQR